MSTAPFPYTRPRSRNLPREKGRYIAVALRLIKNGGRVGGQDCVGSVRFEHISKFYEAQLGGDNAVKQLGSFWVSRGQFRILRCTTALSKSSYDNGIEWAKYTVIFGCFWMTARSIQVLLVEMSRFAIIS